MQKLAKSINLTLLGGVNEVGGNTILLEDLTFDVKLFIDFGIKIKKYYKQYERDEYPSTIDELQKINLIPNEDLISIDNLYTKEFRDVKLNQTVKKIGNTQHIDSQHPSNLDGILISHPHRDHYFGYPSLIARFQSTREWSPSE